MTLSASPCAADRFDAAYAWEQTDRLQAAHETMQRGDNDIEIPHVTFAIAKGVNNSDAGLAPENLRWI
jgi:hypothetical protein